MSAVCRVACRDRPEADLPNWDMAVREAQACGKVPERLDMAIIYSR